MTDVNDFLSDYPSITNSSFNCIITYKKEFNDYKLLPNTRKIDQYYDDQKIIQRFLSSHTPYNSILIGLLLYKGVSHNEEGIVQLPNRLKRILIFFYIIF